MSLEKVEERFSSFISAVLKREARNGRGERLRAEYLRVARLLNRLNVSTVTTDSQLQPYLRAVVKFADLVASKLPKRALGDVTAVVTTLNAVGESVSRTPEDVRTKAKTILEAFDDLTRLISTHLEGSGDFIPPRLDTSALDVSLLTKAVELLQEFEVASSVFSSREKLLRELRTYLTEEDVAFGVDSLRKKVQEANTWKELQKVLDEIPGAEDLKRKLSDAPEAAARERAKEQLQVLKRALEKGFDVLRDICRETGVSAEEFSLQLSRAVAQERLRPFVESLNLSDASKELLLQVVESDADAAFAYLAASQTPAGFETLRLLKTRDVEDVLGEPVVEKYLQDITGRFLGEAVESPVSPSVKEMVLEAVAESGEKIFESLQKGDQAALQLIDRLSIPEKYKRVAKDALSLQGGGLVEALRPKIKALWEAQPDLYEIATPQSITSPKRLREVVDEFLSKRGEVSLSDVESLAEASSLSASLIPVLLREPFATAFFGWTYVPNDLSPAEIVDFIHSSWPAAIVDSRLREAREIARKILQGEEVTAAAPKEIYPFGKSDFVSDVTRGQISVRSVIDYVKEVENAGPAALPLFMPELENLLRQLYADFPGIGDVLPRDEAFDLLTSGKLDELRENLLQVEKQKKVFKAQAAPVEKMPEELQQFGAALKSLFDDVARARSYRDPKDKSTELLGAFNSFSSAVESLLDKVGPAVESRDVPQLAQMQKALRALQRRLNSRVAAITDLRVAFDNGSLSVRDFDRILETHVEQALASVRAVDLGSQLHLLDKLLRGPTLQPYKVKAPEVKKETRPRVLREKMFLVKEMARELAQRHVSRFKDAVSSLVEGSTTRSYFDFLETLKPETPQSSRSLAKAYQQILSEASKNFDFYVYDEQGRRGERVQVLYPEPYFSFFYDLKELLDRVAREVGIDNAARYVGPALYVYVDTFVSTLDSRYAGLRRVLLSRPSSTSPEAYRSLRVRLSKDVKEALRWLKESKEKTLEDLAQKIAEEQMLTPEEAKETFAYKQIKSMFSAAREKLLKKVKYEASPYRLYVPYRELSSLNLSAIQAITGVFEAQGMMIPLGMYVVETTEGPRFVSREMLEELEEEIGGQALAVVVPTRSERLGVLGLLSSLDTVYNSKVGALVDLAEMYVSAVKSEDEEQIADLRERIREQILVLLRDRPWESGRLSPIVSQVENILETKDPEVLSSLFDDLVSMCDSFVGAPTEVDPRAVNARIDEELGSFLVVLAGLDKEELDKATQVFGSVALPPYDEDVPYASVVSEAITASLMDADVSSALLYSLAQSVGLLCEEFPTYSRDVLNAVVTILRAARDAPATEGSESQFSLGLALDVFGDFVEGTIIDPVTLETPPPLPADSNTSSLLLSVFDETTLEGVLSRLRAIAASAEVPDHVARVLGKTADTIEEVARNLWEASSFLNAAYSKVIENYTPHFFPTKDLQPLIERYLSNLRKWEVALRKLDVPRTHLRVQNLIRRLQVAKENPIEAPAIFSDALREIQELTQEISSLVKKSAKVAQLPGEEMLEDIEKITEQLTQSFSEMTDSLTEIVEVDPDAAADLIEETEEALERSVVEPDAERMRDSVGEELGTLLLLLKSSSATKGSIAQALMILRSLKDRPLEEIESALQSQTELADEFTGAILTTTLRILRSLGVGALETVISALEEAADVETALRERLERLPEDVKKTLREIANNPLRKNEYLEALSQSLQERGYDPSAVRQFIDSIADLPEFPLLFAPSDLEGLLSTPTVYGFLPTLESLFEMLQEEDLLTPENLRELSQNCEQPLLSRLLDRAAAAIEEGSFGAFLSSMEKVQEEAFFREEEAAEIDNPVDYVRSLLQPGLKMDVKLREVLTFYLRNRLYHLYRSKDPKSVATSLLSLADSADLPEDVRAVIRGFANALSYPPEAKEAIADLQERLPKALQDATAARVLIERIESVRGQFPYIAPQLELLQNHLRSVALALEEGRIVPKGLLRDIDSVFAELNSGSPTYEAAKEIMKSFMGRLYRYDQGFAPEPVPPAVDFIKESLQGVSLDDLKVLSNSAALILRKLQEVSDEEFAAEKERLAGRLQAFIRLHPETQRGVGAVHDFLLLATNKDLAAGALNNLIRASEEVASEVAQPESLQTVVDLAKSLKPENFAALQQMIRSWIVNPERIDQDIELLRQRNAVALAEALRTFVKTQKPDALKVLLQRLQEEQEETVSTTIGRAVLLAEFKKLLLNLSTEEIEEVQRALQLPPEEAAATIRALFARNRVKTAQEDPGVEVADVIEDLLNNPEELRSFLDELKAVVEEVRREKETALPQPESVGELLGEALASLEDPSDFVRNAEILRDYSENLTPETTQEERERLLAAAAPEVRDIALLLTPQECKRIVDQAILFAKRRFEERLDVAGAVAEISEKVRTFASQNPEQAVWIYLCLRDPAMRSVAPAEATSFLQEITPEKLLRDAELLGMRDKVYHDFTNAVSGAIREVLGANFGSLYRDIQKQVKERARESAAPVIRRIREEYLFLSDEIVDAMYGEGVSDYEKLPPPFDTLSDPQIREEARRQYVSSLGNRAARVANELLRNPNVLIYLAEIRESLTGNIDDLNNIENPVVRSALTTLLSQIRSERGRKTFASLLRLQLSAVALRITRPVPTRPAPPLHLEITAQPTGPLTLTFEGISPRSLLLVDLPRLESARTDLTEAESRIQGVRTALQQGDYDTAWEGIQEAGRLLSSVCGALKRVRGLKEFSNELFEQFRAFAADIKSKGLSLSVKRDIETQLCETVASMLREAVDDWYEQSLKLQERARANLTIRSGDVVRFKTPEGEELEGNVRDYDARNDVYTVNVPSDIVVPLADIVEPQLNPFAQWLSRNVGKVAQVMLNLDDALEKVERAIQALSYQPAVPESIEESLKEIFATTPTPGVYSVALTLDMPGVELLHLDIDVMGFVERQEFEEFSNYLIQNPDKKNDLLSFMTDLRDLILSTRAVREQISEELPIDANTPVRVVVEGTEVEGIVVGAGDRPYTLTVRRFEETRVPANWILSKVEAKTATLQDWELKVALEALKDGDLSVVYQMLKTELQERQMAQESKTSPKEYYYPEDIKSFSPYLGPQLLSDDDRGSATFIGPFRGY